MRRWFLGRSSSSGLHGGASGEIATNSFMVFMLLHLNCKKKTKNAVN